MKTSELTVQNIADYLRIDDAGEIEKEEINNMRLSAIAYLKSYTGLTEKELDEHEDITHALLLLIADMYDNRNIYLEGKSGSRNKAIDSILNMHSVNLL